MRRVIASLLAGIALYSFAADSRSFSIVFLGASQVAGPLVSPAQSLPSQLEARLRQDGYAATVSNQGVSGNTTDMMLARLGTAVPSGTDMVVFHTGSNDCLRKKGISEEATTTSVGGILAALSARHIAVLVLGSSCRDEITSAQAAHYGARYYGHIGQGMDSYTTPDGQHYKADGYQHLATLLAPPVEEMLNNPIH